MSSDEIRKELGGELEFGADQAIVFREVRDRARKHLAQGDNVVIDAMNLELAHRMRQISIMPRDLLVRYVVIDRPLESKQRDAGWRAEKGIVERYHGRFRADHPHPALGQDLTPSSTARRAQDVLATDLVVEGVEAGASSGYLQSA